MVTVELTRHLFTFFPALKGRALECEATTVAEVIRAVEALAEGFTFYICDERGRLRPHVNIFIGDTRIADRKQLSDRVPDGGRVFILQALSGG